jgi:hypothetical protein
MKAFVSAALLLLAGCSALTLAPSDYSWPIESELTADKNGMVTEDRYHMTFSVKPLLFAEFQDSMKVSGKTFRIIRDQEGYFFITGPQFKNVYVFEHKPAGLAQSAKIPVSEKGLGSPAFNRRPPYIQLLNGRDKPLLLTRSGIQTPDDQKGGSK